MLATLGRWVPHTSHQPLTRPRARRTHTTPHHRARLATAGDGAEAAAVRDACLGQARAFLAGCSPRPAPVGVADEDLASDQDPRSPSASPLTLEGLASLLAENAPLVGAALQEGAKGDASAR